jgi:hypothetical protein
VLALLRRRTQIALLRALGVTRGTVLFWLTVRFIGPAAGWWHLSDG